MLKAKMEEFHTGTTGMGCAKALWEKEAGNSWRLETQPIWPEGGKLGLRERKMGSWPPGGFIGILLVLQQTTLSHKAV